MIHYATGGAPNPWCGADPIREGTMLLTSDKIDTVTCRTCLRRVRDHHTPEDMVADRWISDLIHSRQN